MFRNIKSAFLQYGHKLDILLFEYTVITVLGIWKKWISKYLLGQSTLILSPVFRKFYQLWCKLEMGPNRSLISYLVGS